MEEFKTMSGIPVKTVYVPDDLRGWNYERKLGNPGDHPFTRANRGMSPAEYWRSRIGGGKYVGFGTPETTNKWLKFLLSEGATSVSGGALDLPTQIGYDSDHLLALGEVGKQGVSLCSLADTEVLYDGIPVDQVSPTSVVSAIGPIFLAWAIAFNEKRGVPVEDVRISTQNDCLKEFIARGTQIFPIKPSVKVSCDVVEYCVRNNMKSASPMQVSGTHMREAGATAPQEIAFTMANAVAYIEELVDRGLNVDDCLDKIMVFMAAGMDFFEEACKFRAMRRMWARIMREMFLATTPPLIIAYTSGSYFTAQQPLNNIVRGTVELIGAMLGGLPSAGMTCYDEALALPSEDAMKIALRTPQIVAYESGIFNTLDPLGGSYYVEALTDELEERATDLFDKVQAMGGAISAIEQGFQQREIAISAYEKQRKIDSGETVVVGVNKYVTGEPLTIEVRKVDPEEERRQVEKVKKLRRERDNEKVKACLKQVKAAAEEGINTVSSILEAVKAYATVGEICDTLRGVWGEYQPTSGGL